MTTRLAAGLAALLALAACQGPAPTSPAPGFDARAWLRGLEPDTAWGRDTPVYSGATRAQRRVLRAAAPWSDECEAMYEEHTSWAEQDFGAVTVFEAAPDLHLAQVQCDAGAYQGLFALARLRGADAAVVPLEVPRWDDARGFLPEVETDLLIGDVFPVSTERFDVLERGRGLADYGTLFRYRLDETPGGPRGILLEILHGEDRGTYDENVNATCDGEPCVDPTRWPRVWPDTTR